jgi:hypothetical protein
LLSIRVTILDVVVAHLLVCEGLVGLGEFDVEVGKRFDSLVLGGVRSDLVGMVLEGKALVVRLNLLLIEGLGEAVLVLLV